MKTLFSFITISLMMACGTQDKSPTITSLPEQDKEYKKLLAEQNDWAQLNRYQKANTRVKRITSNEETVIFMGDSITEGWRTLSPDFFEKHPYINRGISGQTTPQMLIRFRQDVVDLNPRAVVLLCGINDIAGNTGPSTLEMIQHNITSMVEIAQANDIAVVLSSILPAASFPWKPEVDPVSRVDAMNTWLKDYAQKNGCLYVDYFSAMVENDGIALREELSPDGVHPNKEGYDIMEPIIQMALRMVLASEENSI